MLPIGLNSFIPIASCLISPCYSGWADIIGAAIMDFDGFDMLANGDWCFEMCYDQFHIVIVLDRVPHMCIPLF